MTAKSSARKGKILLIAIHTNEGPNPADIFPDRTAENLCRWMDGQKVSYHKVVDDDSVVNYVPDERYSWSLRSGNSRSLNLCFTGYARFDRREWLSHEGMLKQGALEVRRWCDKYGIPRKKLSPSQVKADMSGICGHVDWTRGKLDGNHTDPGDHFPWDVFMSLIEGEDMSAKDVWYGVNIDNFQKQKVLPVDILRATEQRCNDIAHRLEDTVQAILKRWEQEDEERGQIHQAIKAIQSRLERVK